MEETSYLDPSRLLSVDFEVFGLVQGKKLIHFLYFIFCIYLYIVSFVYEALLLMKCEDSTDMYEIEIERYVYIV
jgi:hypothetical protein